MTVTVSKPQLNLREELSALKKKSGIKGEELLRVNTTDEAYALLNPTMFRNKVINGDFRIDQRKAGATGVYDNTKSYQYLSADRFLAVAAGTSTLTLQQKNSFNASASNYEANSAPRGFTNSLKVTVGTSDASNSYHIRQRIEGYNTADLAWGTTAARPATLSFWVKCSIPGKYAVNVFNYNHDFAYVANYIINSANTWEYKVIAIPPAPASAPTPFYQDTTVGVQLAWMFSNTGTPTTPNVWATPSSMNIAGDSTIMTTPGATWYITGIQFEAGSVATPFEYRPYQTELAMCQRYYQRLTANASADIVFPASLNPGSTNNLVSYFPCVTMRAAPTTSSNTTTWGYCRNGGSFTAYTTNAVPSVGSGATPSFVPFYANVASGLTSAGIGLTYISTTNWVDFSAEL